MAASRRASPRPRRVLLAAAALAALAGPGCQPADDPELTPDAGQERTDGDRGQDAAGAPDAGPPTTFDGLRERGGEAAEEWQAGARLVEVSVWLDDDAVTGGRLTYLAGHADRFFVFAVENGAVREQRPTLETLQLPPVSEVGLDEVEAFPDGAQGPAELAGRVEGLFDDCGVGGPVTSVVYTTGAPMSWDGSTWSSTPVWEAVVLGDDGGVIIDPVTAEPAAEPCA